MEMLVEIVVPLIWGGQAVGIGNYGVQKYTWSGVVDSTKTAD